MARFRCPSASAVDLAPSDIPNDAAARLPRHRSRIAIPSKHNKKHGKAKTPTGMNAGQKEHMRMALKREQLKSRRNQPQWSFIYVSNLNSKISDAELQRTFERFGRIRRIIRRASGGIVVKGYGGSDPSMDRQYASIQYVNPSSARRALILNKRKLNGVELVVCFSAADLPETARIIQEHIRRKHGPPPRTFNLKNPWTFVKRLTVHRTQRSIFPDDSPGISHNRHVAMGTSFAMTVM
ncbi:hypothetical protein BKA93DRAFT_134548 [Sparassis latifolia]|uniref:RRM domain-containing protein n=1 Tax=Sparassis crispa TaxID=139825 RepID=A0A401GAQ6_9APHY|nr:predicted protein [Sparassis crispa]GBE79242.1 predicted protein [Sparassis crispa]